MVGSSAMREFKVVGLRFKGREERKEDSCFRGNDKEIGNTRAINCAITERTMKKIKVVLLWWRCWYQ